MRLHTLALTLLAGCFAVTEPGTIDTGDIDPITDSGIPLPLSEWLLELEESRSTWDALKTQLGDDYVYTSSESSYSGVTATTTITVVDGVVLERRYDEACSYTGCATDSWSETGADIGTHGAGASAITVDGVYDVCRDEVLTKDLAQYELKLAFHDDGILDDCLHIDRDCADDCDGGVRIDAIEAYVH